MSIPLPSRRNTLFALGGGLALAAAGGVWRVTRLPENAVHPWQALGASTGDIRLDAFRHAILAPNPHNRQPWQIRLVGADEAIVTCDLARRLPVTDPFDRQITIGFGGFVELAVIAAAERGCRVEVTPFPEGAGEMRLDARPIVHLRFSRDPALARDPLFAQIATRRSAKMPYDLARPVLKSALGALAALSGDGLRLGFASEGALVAALRGLIIAAMRLELETPHTLKESIDLARVGAAEIDASPDGISLKGPMFEALSLLGTEAVRRQSLDTASSAFRSTLARYEAMFAATPAFVWLISAENDRRAQLMAGRRYVRLNLMASALGLSLHPVSQALQEFPEMRVHYARVNELCGAEGGERLQMLARLGYSAPVGPSPRWPLEAKLIV